MKKITILITALVLSLTACQEDKGYFLTGTVDGVEDGKKVYISELDGNNRTPKAVDTATITDGKFELNMEDPETPNLSFLSVEGVNGNVVFISENQTLRFDIDTDSIRNTEVVGGKENKALYEYLGHLKELNRKMQKMQNEMRQAMVAKDTAKLKSLQETQAELRDNDKNFKQELFQRNKDSFLAVMILTDMLNMKTHSSAEVREMYAEVSDRIKKTDLAKSLEETLERYSATEIGSKAPSFSGPTPEGEEFKLEDNLGKVTVVDFWAAWCKPCRVENPNLVRTYNKYKDQGLNVISVSLDRPGQKDKWLQAIEDDNLEQWDHVSNLQFWNDPIAKKYGVRAIPATFILDENGVIVAKNLRGDELANKIGELLQ
ncbi:TlpA disulfide reductase family protein [Christiangramia crocea]|uniref:Redoxin domain-containing protein n=1 Tax=Christiangramia crocea TaxID=2904124 RepID=A0A9X1UV64_9FLAO|nr:TlpA disulfide reductase family protein [Gramella crocea]MCG9970069.1 redoxin domain-containing protein [Gramella crocea]